MSFAKKAAIVSRGEGELNPALQTYAPMFRSKIEINVQKGQIGPRGEHWKVKLFDVITFNIQAK